MKEIELWVKNQTHPHAILITDTIATGPAQNRKSMRSL